MGIKKIAIVGHGLHSGSIAATTTLSERTGVTVIDNQPEPMKYSITNKREPIEQERHVYSHMPRVRKSPKVYPNDPCTCGSGKKFKKCCK